jgi:hypothetical protein
MACRSSGLQLNLLGRLILEADGRDEVELRLQPLDVLLALNDQVLEEFPRADIALLQTEGDLHIKAWRKYWLTAVTSPLRTSLSCVMTSDEPFMCHPP